MKIPKTRKEIYKKIEILESDIQHLHAEVENKFDELRMCRELLASTEPRKSVRAPESLIRESHRSEVRLQI